MGCKTNKEADTAGVNEVAVGWKLVLEERTEVEAAEGTVLGTVIWCVVAPSSQEERERERDPVSEQAEWV